MRITIAAAFVALVFAGGCVSTDVTPVSQNMIIINTSAAPACSGRDARQIAFRQAAVETLRRGFDKFIVVDAASQDNVRVVGYSFTYYGITPVTGGSREQQLAIEMFVASDPRGRNALDARTELGPEWQTIIATDQNNCF